SRREESLGVLADVGETAAVIRGRDDEVLSELDLLFACDTQPEDVDLLARMPDGLRSVWLSPTIPVPGAAVAVAGEPLSDLADSRVVVSPHPAVIALTHLLRPLEDLGLRSASATLLRPASMYDQGALDEMFEQTRALLAFHTPEAGEHFERQMAFNLLPGPGDEDVIVDQLSAVFGARVPIAVQTLQASVFHGFSLSLLVELEESIGVDDLASAFDDARFVSRMNERESASPVDAVASEEIVTGRLIPAKGLPGQFWVWAVFDNLTIGGASNALALARRMLGSDKAR
ncbi:MAG: Asd/ArgC dimerization domain-containing protein, partial [Acidobacteriota bacterium]|nr:Asd/ArgC dimerization domain-containing protein [Acidobacteriota bacterium]